MRLLVSVRDALEAGEAVAGGAHIIDAKDPARGPLGAVGPEALAAIVARVGTLRPVSAALGDLRDEHVAEREARRGADAGVAFIKLGFAGVADERHAATTLAAAVQGCAVARRCSVVAVAYADAESVGAPSPDALIEVAAEAGAAGVLLDTADKHGPGLLELWSSEVLARWVADVRRAGLDVGLAGRLSADDIATLRVLGMDVDVVGVRGAACEGGREGRVASAKVKALVELVGGRDDDGQPFGPRSGEERIQHVTV